jgi:hypothetical protein
VNIDKAEQLLKEDRRLSLRKLYGSLLVVGKSLPYHYSGIRDEVFAQGGFLVIAVISREESM